MSKFKAVFFDLDDTLYPAVETYRYGLQNAWRVFRRKKKVSFAAFLRGYKKARGQVQSLLKNDPSRRNRLLYFKRFVENEMGRPAPELVLALSSAYDACFQRLKPLKQPWLKRLSMRYRLGIITNLTGHMQMLKLRRLDPGAKLFPVVVTSEEAGAEKPSSLPYKEACRRARCRPGEAVMIGNSRATDVLAARRAGLWAVHLDPAGRTKSFHSRIATVRVLEDVPQLLEDAR